MIRSVGIVGYGAFGRFIALLLKRYVPGTYVRFYSRTHKPAGDEFYTLEDVAECDVVILAVPIHALEHWIKKIVPLMSPEGILVDVSTVKKYPVQLLKKFAKGKKYLATHPMFGPESYEKKGGHVHGFRIVISESAVPEQKVKEFCQHLIKLGFNIVHMEADRHDKHLAETLFLTHFIGQVVSNAKFDRTEIDTVSFGYLMDAVESVKHDKKLFQDVFKYNPYCKMVLKKFGIAESQVKKLLQKK